MLLFFSGETINTFRGTGVLEVNNPKRMNDNQLLKECLRGDTEKFKVIVEKYRGKTLALAVNVLGNRQDAEDACQEAFLQVYSHLNAFDFKKNFSNWLFSILYKRCLDQLRKRQRFFSFFKKSKGVYEELAGSQALRFSKQDPVPHGMLEKLSPKERSSLYLWAVEGYTGKEIAEILGCSPGTARIHLFKARKKIKSLLEKEDV